MRSSGRGKLPTCVVRMRASLRFMSRAIVGPVRGTKAPHGGSQKDHRAGRQDGQARAICGYDLRRENQGQGRHLMAVATRVLDLHLLTWNGLVKCRVSPGASKA